MNSSRKASWLRPSAAVTVVALLAVSAPFLLRQRGDPAWALEVAALRVDEALSKARQLALTSGRAHAVVFDTERERFGILDIDGVLATDRDTGGAALFELSGMPGGRDVDLVEAVFGGNEPTALVASDGSLVVSGRLVLRCGDVVREWQLAVTGKHAGEIAAEWSAPASAGEPAQDPDPGAPEPGSEPLADDSAPF